MHEYLPLLLTVAIAMGLYQFERIRQRLDRSEAKMDALLKHLGAEWGKFQQPSEQVRVLARTPGARIQAIKAYREQTGLGLKEAQDVIEKLARDAV